MAILLPGCRGTLPFVSPPAALPTAEESQGGEDVTPIDPLFSVANFTPELRTAYRLLSHPPDPATRQSVSLQPARVHIRLWAVSESALERLADDTAMGDAVTRDPFVELAGTGGVRLAFLNAVDAWILEESLTGDVYSEQVHGTFLELEPDRPTTDTPEEWAKEHFAVARHSLDVIAAQSSRYTATPIVPVFTTQGGAVNDGTLMLDRLRVELPNFSLRKSWPIRERSYRDGLTKFTTRREVLQTTVPSVELPPLHIPPGATLLVRIPGEVEVVTTGSHPLKTVATRRNRESGDFLILISDRDLPYLPPSGTPPGPLSGPPREIRSTIP